jgi:hypothetical protein
MHECTKVLILPFVFFLNARILHCSHVRWWPLDGCRRGCERRRAVPIWAFTSPMWGQRSRGCCMDVAELVMTVAGNSGSCQSSGGYGSLPGWRWKLVMALRLAVCWRPWFCSYVGKELWWRGCEATRSVLAQSLEVGGDRNISKRIVLQYLLTMTSSRDYEIPVARDLVASPEATTRLWKDRISD